MNALTELEEVLTPDSQLVWSDLSDLVDPYHLGMASEVCISKLRVFHEGNSDPQTQSLLTESHLSAFSFVVVEKVAIFTAVEFLSKEEDQLVVELKLTRILVPELVQAV